jgi:hypothetical protein
MRDLYRTINYIERTFTRGLERKAATPREKPKPSSCVWRAPDIRYPAEQIFKPKGKPMA